MSAVYVCRGCKGRAALVEQLRDEIDADVQLVRCQKICHGPVVGVPVGERVEWFERVSKPKRVAALIHLIDRGRRKVPERLERVRVRKRSGRAPR